MENKNFKKHSDGIRKKKLVIDLSRKTKSVAEDKAVLAEGDLSSMEVSADMLPKIKRFSSQNQGMVINEMPAEEPVVTEYAESFEETPTVEYFAEVQEESLARGRKILAKFRFGSPWSKRKIYAYGIGGSLFFMFLMLTTVFAKMTITFKPKIESLPLAGAVLAMDVSVSQTLVPQKVIPAERLEFPKNVSREFEATGKKYIEEKSTGKVRIYNAYSSAPQKLVASTRFATNAGNVYRLTQTITIPGANIAEGKILPRYAEAELAADVAGESQNTDKETTLKVLGFKGSPKYDAFYAVAPKGFSSGFKGESKVVTKEDLAKAQAETTKAAYDELKDELVKKVPQNFKTIDGLREIQIVKVISPKENSPADKFTVEAQGRGRVIVFREKDTLDLVKSFMLKDDQTKDLLPDASAITYQVQNVDFNKGRAVVALGGNAKTVMKVLEKDIVSLISGQKSGSVDEFLRSRGELASFNLSLFPPWRTSAPKDESKIKLIKQE